MQIETSPGTGIYTLESWYYLNGTVIFRACICFWFWTQNNSADTESFFVLNLLILMTVLRMITSQDDHYYPCDVKSFMISFWAAQAQFRCEYSSRLGRVASQSICALASVNWDSRSKGTLPLHSAQSVSFAEIFSALISRFCAQYMSS